jgi:exodeoxyribonuclease VIII
MRKTAKKKWAEFEKDHPGKTVVTFEEMQMVNAMAESVGKSETASALLSGGKAEQSVFWKDPVHGFLCKCRPDFLNPKYEVIVDLKTTNDVSPEAFSKSVANFKYHFQAVHYLAGCEAVMPDQYGAFIFVCVETKEPYPVATYVLDHDSLNVAEVEMEPLLNRYAQCMENDTWEGLPDEVEVISLPGWAKNRVLFN